MAAGKDPGDVVRLEPVEVAEDVERELAQEGEVVGGVDHQGAPRAGGEALHVGDGADAGEGLAELVLGEAGLLERGADMAGALAGPADGPRGRWGGVGGG